jgi:hypothetical protein
METLLFAIIITFVFLFFVYKNTIPKTNEFWINKGYEFQENVYGDMINHLNGARSIWVKGKNIRYGNSLHEIKKEDEQSN